MSDIEKAEKIIAYIMYKSFEADDEVYKRLTENE